MKRKLHRSFVAHVNKTTTLKTNKPTNNKHMTQQIIQFSKQQARETNNKRTHTKAGAKETQAKTKTNKKKAYYVNAVLINS